MVVRNPETWQGYESKARIEELIADGVTITAIARRFGKSRTAIYDVLNQKGGESNNSPAQSSTPATPGVSDLSEPSVPGETGLEAPIARGA